MQDFFFFFLSYKQIILISISVLLAVLLIYRVLKDFSSVKEKAKKQPAVKVKKILQTETILEQPSDIKKKRRSIDTSILRDEKKIENQAQVFEAKNISSSPAPSNACNFSGVEIRNKIFYFLTETEKDGASFQRIKKYCRACFDFDDLNVKKNFDTEFQTAFDFLKDSYAVTYQKKEKIWMFRPENYQNVILHPLTDDEKGYFKFKNLGTGWKRLGVGDKYAMHAIWWLHQNLTPDEFEQFCCALLSHHGVKNLRVSEKRASGADGGIDGLGEYEIDGEVVNVLIQAKKYRPNRWVETDEADKFIGALTKKRVNRGFFITTGTFTDRTAQEVHDVTEDLGNKIEIELLDQNRIIDALLYKADSTHGYGLHKTDKGFYYINIGMLRDAIAEYA